MEYKQIPDLVVGDLIYFCQRWWSVIAIKPIADRTKQTCLTLKTTHLTINQHFDDCVFVRFQKEEKSSQQEFTRKEVIDWPRKTEATFQNFEVLEAKRRRHLKRGKDDDS